MQPATDTAGSVRPSLLAINETGPRSTQGRRQAAEAEDQTLLRCTRTGNTDCRPVRAIINQCLHIRHRIPDMFPRPLGRPVLSSMGRVGGDSKCVSHRQLNVVLHNPSGASASLSLISHFLPFSTPPKHLGDHTSLGCPVRTPPLLLPRTDTENTYKK